MTVKVDLKNYAVFVDGVQKGLKTSMIRGVRSAARRLMNEIILRIVPSKIPEPFDRELYKAGWKVDNLINGALIRNEELHSAFIEYGVAADKVKISRQMIAMLRDWLVRKGYATEQDSRDKAWALARNLQRRGIFNRGKGFRPLQEALDRFAIQYIQEEIASEIANQLEKIK
jgi:hypothetical protein